MELNDIGKVLEKYRKNDGISMREQARKMDIGISYLCDISHGNRNMTVQVLKKVLKVYKYQCVGDDFLILASGCYDKDIFHRYKLRNHIADSTQAVRDLIFVFTGENI